jgi:hypothetical protein
MQAGVPLFKAKTTGYPTSANQASSFHLHWQLPSGTGPVVAAAVQLMVEAAPPVPDLYFWALQASFTGGGSRRHGGAHLGLQWNRRHPGNLAANWGGYAPSGSILEGTASPLPSTPRDPNTRDFDWAPGRAHTLRIAPDPGDEGGWVGTIDGVRIRTLLAGGERLDGLMVWSEVFARCDAPPVAVRWSGFRAETADGQVVAPTALSVNYQRRDAGGCDNTTVVAADDGIWQVTNSERLVPQGARLAL